MRHQGRHGGDAAHQGLRCHRHVRRPDRRPIELWYFVQRPRRRQHAAAVARRLLQPERRRSRQVVVCARTPSRPECSDRTFENASGRLTWQMTLAQQDDGGFWDAQALCRTVHRRDSWTRRSRARVAGSGGRSSAGRCTCRRSPGRHPSRTGCSARRGLWRHILRRGQLRALSLNPDARSDSRRRSSARAAARRTATFRGWSIDRRTSASPTPVRICGRHRSSYVTGTHSLKVGYQHTLMTDDRTWMTNNQNLTYRVQQRRAESADRVDFAVGEQRARRLGRRVRPGAVDARSSDAAGRGPVRSRPAAGSPRSRKGRRDSCRRPSSFPRRAASTATRTSRRGWASAYDLFGHRQDGAQDEPWQVPRGRRVCRATTPTPIRRCGCRRRRPVFGTAGVTRAWTDANGNFVPDCDLLNPAAQDLSGGRRRSLRRRCRTRASAQNVLTNNFDAGRPQRLGRASIGLEPRRLDCSSRFERGRRWRWRTRRRWYHGFFVADNLALQPADLTPFSMVAPRIPDCPEAGATSCRVCTTWSRTRPDRSTTSSPTRQVWNVVSAFQRRST